MDAEELIALVRRAQAGDDGARHEVLAELYRAVRKHVFFTVRSGMVAEEVVQETIIAVDRGLSGFRGDTGSPRTWALRIATRIAARLVEKEDRYQLTEDGAVDVVMLDPELAAAAEVVALRRALACLSPKKRDVFVLMAIFELSAEETGDVLDVPTGTAASRYHFAREELEAHIRKFEQLAHVRGTKPPRR